MKRWMAWALAMLLAARAPMDVTDAVCLADMTPEEYEGWYELVMEAQDEQARTIQKQGIPASLQELLGPVWKLYMGD